MSNSVQQLQTAWSAPGGSGRHAMNPSLGARARRPWLATVCRTHPGRTAIVCALLLSLLSGCGFHLQGASSLPEGSRRIYLATADELTPFAVELRQALEHSGGQIATAASEADLVVRIAGDRSGRRVLSVSARNTPQEYEVYYNVEYSVDRGDQEIIELQPLELIRNLNFDEAKVLAKDREEALLRDAMARDLALLVVRRLESL